MLTNIIATRKTFRDVFTSASVSMNTDNLPLLKAGRIPKHWAHLRSCRTYWPMALSGLGIKGRLSSIFKKDSLTGVLPKKCPAFAYNKSEHFISIVFFDILSSQLKLLHSIGLRTCS